jgi:hypothetical protein
VFCRLPGHFSTSSPISMKLNLVVSSVTVTLIVFIQQYSTNIATVQACEVVATLRHLN